jgi:hypothetical protein
VARRWTAGPWGKRGLRSQAVDNDTTEAGKACGVGPPGQVRRCRCRPAIGPRPTRYAICRCDPGIVSVLFVAATRLDRSEMPMDKPSHDVHEGLGAGSASVALAAPPAEAHGVVEVLLDGDELALAAEAGLGEHHLALAAA